MVRAAGRKFDISVHIMLGLPGESHAMMMATADQVARWHPAGVKIHNLYAVEKTPMADEVRAGKTRLLELDEYVSLLADFLERIPPDVVIERVSGDAPPKDLIGPAWCLEKGEIIKRLNAEFERRGTHQGARYGSG